ncbi:dnaJ homolog subfamily B member 7-like isoform X2 [Pyrus x bretschneideri]|uniref:dnaJ homolog subfamily B member 7-like isoform X2 n=1 Tax=Pyrus x bretschneideri TaxID=225117 RepID=UPI00202FFEFD|nr:dnaJ homolog subfamily B member 7-like isoform X2 [Pyrus x bretschneideri]
MADGEEKGSDFYAVLGLDKECTDSELRNAYKKLALRWHPDRCSAPGNSKFVEEAKIKFQDIQQAYSGAYGSDDDENNGMGEFLNEMAMMMSQTKPNEDGKETFEELQDLFDEMFQGDIGSYGSASRTPSSCSTSSYASYCESSSSNNKRDCSEMNYEKVTLDDPSGFDNHFPSFCVGVGSRQDNGKATAAREGIRAETTGNRRQGRKQKVTSGHDVSSNDYSGISAR